MSKRKKTISSLMRTYKFKLLVDGDYGAVLRSIRAHRFLARKLISTIGMFESVGAELNVVGEHVNVDLQKDGTKELMRVFGDIVKLDGARPAKSNGKPYYELRNFFMAENQKLAMQGIADFQPYVWDNMSQIIGSMHRRVDPNFNNLPRNIKVAKAEIDDVQPSRLGIKVLHCASATPKANLRETGDRKEIILEWDRLLGPVTFVLDGGVQVGSKKYQRKMNAGLKYLFHKFITGEWQWHTVELNERDGDFFVMIPFTRLWARPALRPKPSSTELDVDAILEVSFMKMSGAELAESVDMNDGEAAKTYFIHARKAGFGSRVRRLEIDGVIKSLNRVQSLHEQREIERDCCRRIKNANMQRRIRQQISNLSIKRSNIVKMWNHFWSTEVVMTAVRWGCGKICVFGPPSGKACGNETGGLLGRPWNWYQFKQMVDYKAAERDISVVYEEIPDSVEVLNGQLVQAGVG